MTEAAIPLVSRSLRERGVWPTLDFSKRQGGPSFAFFAKGGLCRPPIP
jgi:hypothetical protein